MPCNGIAADLVPISAVHVVVAGTGSPSRAHVRVWARRESDGLLHRLRLLLLLPVLLLQLVLLRLCRRKLFHCHCAAGEGDRNCRASAAWLTGWLRLSRSETADRTARTSPAGRLMLPAALLRLAAQHCGFFLDPTMIWKGSPGAFPPVGCCWPRLGSITVVGCRFALTCVDSGQHHKRGHEEDRSLPSHEEKKQRVT